MESVVCSSADCSLSEQNSSADSSGVEDIYLMVDSGATLTNRKFQKDLEAVLQRSKRSGVQKIVCKASHAQSSRDALRLSRLYPKTLFSTAGINSHESKLWNEDSEPLITDLIRNPECVAIGECGLDFSHEHSPHVTQLEVFERHVQLACRLKASGCQKPLLVHERHAHQQVIEILSRFAPELPSLVLHGFSGTQQQYVEYSRLQTHSPTYISLSGACLCKDKSESEGVRSLLRDKRIDLKQILVCSDSPWAYPNVRAARLSAVVKSAVTDRSKAFLHRYCTFQRNEPCSLATTVELIGAHLAVRPEEVALQTTYNALKVFALTA